VGASLDTRPSGALGMEGEEKVKTLCHWCCEVNIKPAGSDF